jgi:hypothetical protein
MYGQRLERQRQGVGVGRVLWTTYVYVDAKYLGMEFIRDVCYVLASFRGLWCTMHIVVVLKENIIYPCIWEGGCRHVFMAVSDNTVSIAPASKREHKETLLCTKKASQLDRGEKSA